MSARTYDPTTSTPGGLEYTWLTKLGDEDPCPD
jgi:hypothetical protein